jgi:uncharacterized sporulation protein YeaH/YhbH (DUF444 family)
MDDENLIELYANTYGKATFEKNTSNTYLEELKREILFRFNQANIARLPLDEAVTNEYAVIQGVAKEEIARQLIQKFKLQVKPQGNAKIIVCMDTSGSMGSFEKYLARSFMLWNEMLLMTQYMHLSKILISHHTEAKLNYDENEFYSKGECGGTILSSGLNKVNELINSYDYSKENTYVFIIGDGDNLTSDNEKCQRIIDDIARKSAEVTYFEINQYNRQSTLMPVVRNIKHDNFTRYVVREKTDILNALAALWSKEDKE